MTLIRSQSRSQKQLTQVERFFIALGTFGVFAGTVILIAFLAFGFNEPVSAANPAIDVVQGNKLYTSSADGRIVYTWRTSKGDKSPRYIGKVVADK